MNQPPISNNSNYTPSSIHFDSSSNVWEKLQPFGGNTQYSFYSPTNSQFSDRTYSMNQSAVEFKQQLQNTETSYKMNPSSADVNMLPLYLQINSHPSGILKHSDYSLQKPKKTVKILDSLQPPNSHTHHQLKQLQNLQTTNSQLIQNYSSLYRKYLDLDQKQKDLDVIEKTEVVDEEKFSNFFKERVHQICSFELETALSRLKSTLPMTSIVTNCVNNHK